MAATTIGNVSFGLTSETGIFAQSTTFSGSIEEKWVRNENGEEAHGSFYNPTFTFSVEGFLQTGGNVAGYVLGGTVASANMPTNAHYSGGTTNGNSYITGVEYGKSVEDHQTFNFSGVIKPFS